MTRAARAAVGAMFLLGVACGRGSQERELFELLSPQATGVEFENRLPEDTSFNILNYLYYYNGGGVAAGDVNGDGLPDLFFTSNLGPDRLYLNKGNYRFEDVTDRAGVAGAEGWTSGVTMADVNGDGHLDIYVSGVNYLTMHGRNVLWVNDGDGTFTDRTRELGLEHVGYSTQAAFFDYDADGDLDMYLLNNSVHAERGASTSPQRQPHPRAGDRLFRNDGGRFADVSRAAGIYSGVEGYGLGVVASDLNFDGCIDLYVANDFQENDFLYYNNCDGTFTESIERSTAHTSRFSMGVDAADFDNDLRPDLVVLDMLPEREEILKTSATAESFTLFDLKVQAGYHPQYARNTLQLNRGGGRFSDIGYLAGVHATDWSWAPLFADLDNDGRKDLFITNGIYRRPNDLDYIAYVGDDSRQASLANGVTRANLALLSRMPQVQLPNYAYRNEGDLRFRNVAGEWGLAQPGFSNGAVYVDLNNSGALDLVVSNDNAPAAIYRNRAREDPDRHFLQVRLAGTGGNTAGVGAKVIARYGGTAQLLEQMPTRGFQSSVDTKLHFGLGAATRVDTLLVIWPDRRFQVLRDVVADQTITVSQSEASGRYVYPDSQRALFVDETARSGLSFRHTENRFFDYSREPLMPHLLSTEGPALAVGDVNGDDLDDVFIGGARGQPSALFVQRSDGFSALRQDAFLADSVHEDVDAAFFDADGDGDQDLYVVSGGNEFTESAPPMRDRLYRNDGTGVLQRDTTALPAFFHNGSCVAPADHDGDGDVDLFVGSRDVAGRYGVMPRSYLLENDGRGRFTDVTADRAPALSQVGMVTSAAWVDQDQDGKLDLVVVGEWMPITLMAQRGGRFVDRTREAGLAGTNGWWNHVGTVDVNGDRRPDLVLGNLGLNSYIRASGEQPARLYVHDFGQNGTLEQVLTFYKAGVSYPLAGRDELVRSLTSLRSRYPTYASFGASRVEDIVPASELRQARVLEARTFASALAIARDDGTFDVRPLPTAAQFSPIFASSAADFDGDGRVDLLVGGNFHGVTPARGRYDAGQGLLLRGLGDGNFTAVDASVSGVAIEGQVRDIRPLRSAGGGLQLVVARNNGRLQLLRPLHSSSTERGSR